MGWRVRVALVVGVLWMPRATWADHDELESLARSLSDYESMPDVQALVARGEEAAALLFALYQDPQRPTFVRVRALRALASFPKALTVTRLTTVIEDDRAKPVFLREAALGLARSGETVVIVVGALLDRPTASLRLIAVEALRVIGTAGARARLQAHRLHESDVRVRDAVDAALISAATQK